MGRRADRHQVDHNRRTEGPARGCRGRTLRAWLSRVRAEGCADGCAVRRGQTRSGRTCHARRRCHASCQYAQAVSRLRGGAICCRRGRTGLCERRCHSPTSERTCLGRSHGKRGTAGVSGTRLHLPEIVTRWQARDVLQQLYRRQSAHLDVRFCAPHAADAAHAARRTRIVGDLDGRREHRLFVIHRRRWFESVHEARDRQWPVGAPHHGQKGYATGLVVCCAQDIGRLRGWR